MNFLTYLIKPKKKINKQTNKKCNQSREFYELHALHELMVRKKVIKALYQKAISRIEFVLRGSTPLYTQANEMAFRPEKGVVS